MLCNQKAILNLFIILQHTIMALDQAITTGNSTEKPAATDETCIVSQNILISLVVIEKVKQ